LFATEQIGIALATIVRPAALEEDLAMNLHLSIGPLIALLAGILILAVPRLLNFIVAIYLILVGLIGLFGTGNIHL
jgi:hypothetical protein